MDTRLIDEVQRLRTENAELHELLAITREGAVPAPRTLIPADGTVAEAANGGIVTVAFNIDGQVWSTRMDVLTPSGPDRLLDCRADAERFLFSASMDTAADDAALLIERARAAANTPHPRGMAPITDIAPGAADLPPAASRGELLDDDAFWTQAALSLTEGDDAQ